MAYGEHTTKRLPTVGYYDVLSESNRRLREQDVTISRQAEVISKLQRALELRDEAHAAAMRSAFNFAHRKPE